MNVESRTQQTKLIKPDLNSGKPYLRLSTIKDPDQTTQSSSSSSWEQNKKKKKKQKTQHNGYHKRNSEHISVMAALMTKQPETQNEHKTHLW